MLRNANNGPRHSREKTRQIVARVYKNITIIFNWQNESHCFNSKTNCIFFWKTNQLSCLSVWAFQNVTTKFFKSVRARYEARSFSSSCTSAQWFHMVKSRQKHIYYSFSVISRIFQSNFQDFRFRFCQTVANMSMISQFSRFFSI